MTTLLYRLYKRLRNWLFGPNVLVIRAHTSDYVLETFIEADVEPSTLWAARPLWILADGLPGLLETSGGIEVNRCYEVPSEAASIPIFLKSSAEAKWASMLLPSVLKRHSSANKQWYESETAGDPHDDPHETLVDLE